MNNKWYNIQGKATDAVAEVYIFNEIGAYGITAQDFISERANSFKERRDFVVESLNNIKGISCLKPEGAFYVFPSCKNLLNKKTKLKSDTDFVQKLLEQANVAVVQGSAFGLPGYFRISYATSMENLKKAMERIKNFCEEIN